ncbi:MAG: hypothetical protein IT442_15605 [Phycisphaeraceae bacterium]|nr:hypothetical protein [Phycisphaeraceae bacterium]
MIEDLLGAKEDLVELGKRHGMTVEELAGWILEGENHRVLRGICVLADMQTQVMLSRFRLAAAERLIALAMSREGGEESLDVARRACVDLLKMELKRAEQGVEGEGELAEEMEVGETSAARRAAYRRLGVGRA